MDGDSWPRILLYILFLLGGAYFAAAESAYSAANKIRLRAMAEDGDKKAKSALAISAEFDRALTTLLIGTNIMHIGCASLSTVLGLALWEKLYGAGAGEGLVTTYSTVITTVLVFFVSELIPKSFAKANAEKTACSLAGSLRVIMTLLFPAAFLFQGISKLLKKILPPSDDPTYTEDELVTIIENGEEEGVLDEERSDLLQSAIEFSDTAVSEVMTVREDMEALDIRLPKEKILEAVKKTRHSRIPIYENDPDNVIGVLPIRTFLRKYISRDRLDVRSILYRPLFVAPDTPIHGLFDTMRSSKIYMAVVRDEEGRTLGIATIEDFLEELVGEIWDEGDVVDENFIKLGGYAYDVSASMTVGEALGRMGIRTRDPRLKQKPLGVWMIEALGHFPEEEESFRYGSLTVEASDFDGEGKLSRVILRLRVPDKKKKPEPSPPPAPAAKEGAK